MSEDAKSGWAGMGIGALLTTVFFVFPVRWHLEDVYVPKQEVIKHGAAYYHPETGAFTWREKTEERAE